MYKKEVRFDVVADDIREQSRSELQPKPHHSLHVLPIDDHCPSSSHHRTLFL